MTISRRSNQFMTLMISTSDPLLDVIPFDVPKHPRLPANRFPKSGKAGTIVQGARVAWITGKYLYKFRKKWLAMGLALSVGGSTLFQDGKVPKSTPTGKFNKTYSRYNGRSNFNKFNRSHRCRCPKRRYKRFQTRRY